MPLYVDDLLQDEKCIGLSAAPFGAWTRTFCLMWQKEKPALTMDMEAWETVWNCRGLEEPQKILSQLKKVAEVTENPDGTVTIYSKRVDKELGVLEQKREEGRKRQERWAKRNSKDIEADPNALETDDKHVTNGEAYNSPSLSNSPSLNEGGSGGKQKPKKADIEAIYQEYPRKVGKRDAMTAIRKALDRVDVDDPVGFMIERVKAYARSPAGNAGKYTPHPATWFNQDRWDDDPEEWKQTAKNGTTNGTATQGSTGGKPVLNARQFASLSVEEKLRRAGYAE